jgi:hypothetical protein
MCIRDTRGEIIVRTRSIGLNLRENEVVSAMVKTDQKRPIWTVWTVKVTRH